jgi:AcrR family transcriptional regulator
MAVRRARGTLAGGQDGAAEPTGRPLERVREAARALFAERGYHATAMRDVAAAAGIQIATLYFHCTTKEQLLYDVLCEAQVELADGLRARIAAADPTWADRLAAAIAFHVQFCAERAFGTTISRTDLQALSAEHRAAYVAMRDEYEQQFRALLDGGIVAGEFRPVDTRLTGFAILGIGLTVGRWYDPTGPLSPQVIGAQYGDLILHALRPETAQASGAPG